MSNAYMDWMRDEEEERLRCATAAYCCAECGDKWGECRGWLKTWHNGKCEVCLADAAVCSVRHYGWLKKAAKKEDER